MDSIPGVCFHVSEGTAESREHAGIRQVRHSLDGNDDERPTARLLSPKFTDVAAPRERESSIVVAGHPKRLKTEADVTCQETRISWVGKPAFFVAAAKMAFRCSGACLTRYRR